MRNWLTQETNPPIHDTPDGIPWGTLAVAAPEFQLQIESSSFLFAHLLCVVHQTNYIINTCPCWQNICKK